MQKFDHEKELNKIQNSGNNKPVKTILLMIPVLVLVFCATAFITSSYSTKVTVAKKYTIKIDIINGEENSYIKQVVSGPFKDKISSTASFGSINCSQGELKFDEKENLVYSDKITEDTTCIISFKNDGDKPINYDELESIEDNYGTSYYFKGSAKNNFVTYNNDLYRIIRINGDNTLRLMLVKSIGYSSYGETNEYEKSNARNIVENWFSEKHFDEDKIINGDFDANYYNEQSSPTDLKSITRNYYYKAALLSIKEVILINKNQDNSYINDNTLLINGFEPYDVWTSNGHINCHNYAEIHPVINVKYSSLKGQGTSELPYEIEE